MTSITESAVARQIHRIEIEASPERIWEALTNHEQRFGYGGRVDYDLLPGGTFRAYASEEMIACGAPEVVLEGEVIEADAPLRLVQTWNPLFDEQITAEAATRLTYELEPVGEGVTQVTVTHDLDGAPLTAAMVGGQVPEAGGGWSFVLGDLKALLETGKTLSDRHAGPSVMR